jgi:adenylate kinase
MNIVLVGKPGCGKSSVTKMLLKDFTHMPIIAGDLLRTERGSGSELGKKIQSLIDKGTLVPDNVINDIIEQELNKPIVFGRYYLIDGYPRTIGQAISLDAMLNIQIVIYFDVEDSVVLKRIEDRSKDSGRADDQDIEITKKRLENYYKDTEPVANYYDTRFILYKVDASKPLDDVYSQVKSIIDGVR